MSAHRLKNSAPAARDGATCSVERFGVCHDTATYFAAAHDAILSARRSLTIVGWDIHSQVRLLRNGEEVTLYETLKAAVDARPELEVRILVWNGRTYRHQRELFQRWRFERAHNVRFVKDQSMPETACSHLKLLVVDDALVFAGGVDLAHERWDTAEHEPDDERRVSPDNKRYEPFHDIQYVVTGDVARQLAALARERWADVTGETVAAVDNVEPTWPQSVEAVLRNAEGRLVMTRPPWAHGPLRALEASYLEMIASAEHSIYMENQYLTSTVIVDALRDVLGSPDGPEVVIVAPAHCDGWIEQKTIEPLRKDAFDTLRAADRFHRLRLVSPLSGDTDVFVHAKVCVVDDRFLRIGSANLTDRSMGVDLECDLIIEGHDEGTRSAIRRVRDRFLGVHLGLDDNAVGERLEVMNGSMLRVVDDWTGPHRLEPVMIEEVSSIQVPRELVDPADPGEAEAIFDGTALTARGQGGPRSSIPRVAALVAVAGLGAYGFWRLLRASG